MKNEILKTDRIENLGYVIDVNYYENYVIGRCTNCNGKSQKPVFAYRFNNEKNLLDYVLDFFKKVQNRIDEKNRNAEIKKEALKNFVNPYKVGDVLYDSWGYEQTNIDFYQVIEVKNKSIIIRRIASKLTNENVGNSMAGMVVPSIDEFIEEPELKKITVKVWGGKVNYYVSSKHGSISPYTSGDRGVYCSWYY